MLAKKQTGTKLLSQLRNVYKMYNSHTKNLYMPTSKVGYLRSVLSEY